MTEIEKLYNNAGVEYGSCQNYSRLEQCCNSPFCDSGMCPDGISGEKNSFTAEKQLELIKILGNINIDIDNGCYMSSEILKVEAHCDTFEETLAEFVNNLWQDLTEQEQQQIKEILQ